MAAIRNMAVNRLLPMMQASLFLKRAFCAHHRIAALSTGANRECKLYNMLTFSGRMQSRPWKSLPLFRGRHVNWLCRQISSSGIVFDEYKTVVAPSFAESVTEGDIRWEKAVGDAVVEDEVIGEIETDKTAIPVPAPVSGVIEELLLEDGGKVLAGNELCRIRVTSGAATTSTTPPLSKEEPPSPISEVPPILPPSPSVSGPIPTTPPPIPPVPDKPLKVEPTPPSPSLQTPVSVSHSVGGARTENRVKMTRMRQRIAQRLKEAQNVNAMLTTFNEVDMSSLIEMRKKYQDSFVKRHGIKLGFVSPFVKAACFALQDQPVVNAVIDGGEIVYRDYVDISIAVATPKGLVVPVVRNVETMDYSKIEKSIQILGEKARSGQLAIEDMDGGTFTVSNGGVFGSMFGTPIINPPQSAILGMHGVFDRPVAIDGKVEVRPMMYIALTYDHRLIDGREAVLFLKKIKSAVEDPRVLLLDI